MLQTKTVKQSTLGLLKKLMTIPELDQFFLVGGTNLSLKLGHRISVDLDLFTNEPFDSELIHEVLENHFEDLNVTLKNKGTILCFIEGVKVDLVIYRYEMLNSVETIDSIRFASIHDVIAMKLNAISRRGEKKDYWDVAELLDSYSIAEMLRYFKEKHKSTDIGHIIRSLVYFYDADKSNDPESLKKITWEQVKKKIETALKLYVDEQVSK